MIKKIAIISPDTIPIQLTKDAPELITFHNKTYSIKDKCTRATSFGLRCWNIAEILSKDPEFLVTVFVPNINFPGRENIDFSKIRFDIQPYGLDAATWEWSEELDRKLIQQGFSFVIVQLSYGVGFLNCSVLPNSVNVIVDGYSPILAELPCALIGKQNVFKKIQWKRFYDQYVSLLQRANCILYSNDSQAAYYEGQLFTLGKLDWRAYQFSPLLKVPYGIDINSIEEKETSSSIFKLLWYGSFKSWYYPEKLLEIAESNPNISIDFIGASHPRNNKSYFAYFKKFFTNQKLTNVSIIEDYQDDVSSIYKEYDAGILLSRDWAEEKYSVRVRLLDMLSNGLPVLTNKTNPLFYELYNLKDSIYPLSLENIDSDIKKYYEIKQSVTVSPDSLKYLQDNFNWTNVIEPLKNYIKIF
jgi:hypothetical protein